MDLKSATEGGGRELHARRSRRHDVEILRTEETSVGLRLSHAGREFAQRVAVDEEQPREEVIRDGHRRSHLAAPKGHGRLQDMTGRAGASFPSVGVRAVGPYSLDCEVQTAVMRRRYLTVEDRLTPKRNALPTLEEDEIEWVCGSRGSYNVLEQIYCPRVQSENSN